VRTTVFAVILVALTGAARLDAQTSFPMITHCAPTAVQRGTTAEVTVEGQMNFAGAYKVIVEGTGVTAEVVPPARPADPKAAARSVKLKVTAAGSAPPGVREFRIASPLGVSSLGQLLVVTDPVVAESPGINVPAKAQVVPVPCVVCGRTEAAENVDYYKFRAAAGRVLTFEVHAARLQDKIHDLQKHADPLLAVFDAAGKELAANDDGSFADPLLTFRVPADGEYVVQVRDAKYDGDPRWVYALGITDRPYAAHVFPLGVSGREATVEAIGSAGLRRKAWTLRPGPTPGIHTTLLADDRVVTNPVAYVTSPVAAGVEAEPNDTPAAANALSIPAGMNGRIGAKRDLDHFRFRGAKGEPVALTVYARRFGTPLRSPLDSALDVMTPAGKVLASNDDANGKDAALTFTPPADGDYVVRVRDLNNKGGEAFVYFLQAGPAGPDFSLKVDPSKAMIGPGSRTAWYVQVARTNGFAGPVKVEVKGLPAGVSVSPLTIPPGMTQGVLVVSADKGAKQDAAAVTVLGLTELNGETQVRTATPVEEIYFPGGGRGRFDVRMQAVAVTGPSDLLDVSVKPARVVLKPGQEVKLDVEVKRRADYDKPVTLDVLLRHLGGVHGNPLPPGVTMADGKSKTLLGTGNTGSIVLRAAPDAADCTDVPVCVQGYVPINFVVKIGYASEPVLVSVKK
jgi:hypothetical protein